MRKPRILPTLFLLVALVPLARTAQAQVSGQVTGVVVTEGTSAPVAGAPVLIVSGSDSRSTITDDRGRFRFAKLPPGTYQVSVNGGSPKATHVKLGLARTVTVLMTSTARRPAPEASEATYAASGAR